MRKVLNGDDEKDVDENEDDDDEEEERKLMRMVTTWTLPSSGNTPRLPVLMLPKLLMP